MPEIESVAPLETGVERDTLREIVQTITTVPSGFNLNPKIVSLLSRRDYFIDNLLECARIGRLLRASFFLVDDGEVFAALKGEVVKVFQHFAADGAGIHQIC